MSVFPSRQDVIVIGHKHPDTDSVCSAIAYAHLKNAVSSTRHSAYRAGDINPETAFVLDRFSIPVPPLCDDVSPQVRDMEIRKPRTVTPSHTVREAWEIMRDNDISTLPVVSEDNSLLGVIALKDITVAQMDTIDTHTLSDARTTYENIAKTLNGTIALGDPQHVMSSGHILVGAGNPDVIQTSVHPGDLVLVSNRVSSQLAAIIGGASCLVVCLDAAIDDDIMNMAKNHNCAIIHTPYDTFKAAYFISQSIPIRHYLKSENLITFHLSSPADEVVATMGRTRYVYFPVLDEKGKYFGLISRRNLLNMKRKRLILVDHNERQQCVAGLDEAEVLEVIDHHRVGDLQTNSPIFFRNQPVGCTATIIYGLYRELGVEIPKDIAGILCCAVLSDTLMFRSPTCTELDITAAKKLAEIAGEDMETLGESMFESAENLSGVSAEELIEQDFKIFTAGGKSFGIGQASFLSPANFAGAKEMLLPALEKYRRAAGVSMLFFMLTDIRSSTSELLYAGEGGEELLRDAFKLPEGPIVLDGVVSRKKQLLPPIMSALHSVN